MAISDIARETRKWRLGILDGSIPLPGAGGAAVQASWRFSTSTTAADPGNGRFRLDNADASLATQIYIDDQTNGGFDFSNIFNALQNGDLIYVQNDTDTAEAFVCTVSSVVDNTGWFTINIAVNNTGGDNAWTNNSVFGFLFFSSGGATSPGGGNTSVQYNNAGSFGGDPNFTWNGTTMLVNGNIESQTWVQIGNSNMRFDATAGQIMELSNAVGSTTRLEFQDSTLTEMAYIEANTSNEMHLNGFVFIENTSGIGYVKDTNTSGSTALAGIGFRDSADANMGNIGFRTADGNLQISNQLSSGDINLVTIASGAVNMQFGGVNMARTVIAASGGFEVNNTVTGGGFERVLTVSDISGGGGNVSNTGTPVNNQVPIWTDATTIEGVPEFTFNDVGFTPELTLGVGGAVNSPRLVLNGGTAGSGQIIWEQNSTQRGIFQYLASAAGFTNIIRCMSQAGPFEIGSSNTVNVRIQNGIGMEVVGGSGMTIRLQDDAAGAYADVAGFGQIYIDEGDGLLKFRNSVGTTFDLTDNGAPAGSDQEVQFNDSGSFGASSDLTWNGATLRSLNVIAGNPGNEGTGILIDGVQIDSALKCSSIGASDQAQFIMHRHSTTVTPSLIAARSNSDTNAHGNVVDDLELFAIRAVGWFTDTYEEAARINFVVDGTPGANDMPGRIEFATTPDGSDASVTRVIVDNAGDIWHQNLSAPLDSKIWKWSVNTGTGQISLSAPDDTGGGFAGQPFSITRSGTNAQDGTFAVNDQLFLGGNTEIRLSGALIDMPTATEVRLGTMSFDADQVIGAGQDNFVLTYDNGTGLISLEAATTGGGSTTFTVVTETTTSRAAAVGEFIIADDDTAGSTITINLPAGAANGDEIVVKKTGTTATVVVDGFGGFDIDEQDTYTLTAQYQTVSLIAAGTGHWWIM